MEARIFTVRLLMIPTTMGVSFNNPEGSIRVQIPFGCASPDFMESNPSSFYMGVSENRGTPKSSILIGFSIMNHPFWGIPIFGNTHIPVKPVRLQSMFSQNWADGCTSMDANFHGLVIFMAFMAWSFSWLRLVGRKKTWKTPRFWQNFIMTMNQ